jgi:TolA-binding protein
MLKFGQFDIIKAMGSVCRERKSEVVDLKRLYLVVDVVIGVLIITLIILTVTQRNKTGLYYQDAQKAFTKAENAATSWDINDPKKLSKISDLYRKVFEKYPDSRWADEAIYRLASKIEPSEKEAMILYRRLIKDYPDSEYVVLSLYSIGMGHYDRGDYISAIAEFGKIISDYPDSPFAEKALFNTAMSRYSLGKWDDASLEFQEFETRYPRSQLVDDSQTYRGLIAINKKDYETGIKILEEVIQKYPSSDSADNAQFNIAAAYFEQNKYDEAVAAFEKLINSYSDSEFIQESKIMLTSCYEKQGKDQKAISSLQKFLRQYSDSSYASRAEDFMAEVYLKKLKNVKSAIETYQKIADNTQYDYDIRKKSQYQVGQLYESQKDYAQSIEAYKKLIADFSNPMSTPNQPADKIDKAYIINLQVMQQKIPGQSVPEESKP